MPWGNRDKACEYLLISLEKHLCVCRAPWISPLLLHPRRGCPGHVAKRLSTGLVLETGSIWCWRVRAGLKLCMLQLAVMLFDDTGIKISPKERTGARRARATLINLSVHVEWQLPSTDQKKELKVCICLSHVLLSPMRSRPYPCLRLRSKAQTEPLAMELWPACLWKSGRSDSGIWISSVTPAKRYAWVCLRFILDLRHNLSCSTSLAVHGCGNRKILCP